MIFSCCGLEVQSVYRVCDVTIRKGLAVPVIMNEDDPWPPRFTKQPEIGSKINGYVLLDCFGDAMLPAVFFRFTRDNLVNQKFGFRGLLVGAYLIHTPFLMSSRMTNKQLWYC